MTRRSIGFRCWKDRFAYVVLDGSAEQPVLVTSGHGTAPSSGGRADQLRWLRREVHEILESSHPTDGAFKATEPASRTRDSKRCECEGVLQEAARSHAAALGLSRLLKTQIKKRVGFRGPAKEVADVLAERGLDAVSTANLSDAGLAALAGLARDA